MWTIDKDFLNRQGVNTDWISGKEARNRESGHRSAHEDQECQGRHELAHL
jgi:hypothetical protein